MTRLNENIVQSDHLVAVLLMLSDDSPPHERKQKNDASKFVNYERFLLPGA